MRPGRKPSKQRAILMMESAVQMPALTHTGIGHIDCQSTFFFLFCFSTGSVAESGGLTGNRREEDGQNGQEDVGATHGSG
jgi:hypothetical protein